jgi:hypothetical protein
VRLLQQRQQLVLPLALLPLVVLRRRVAAAGARWPGVGLLLLLLLLAAAAAAVLLPLLWQVAWRSRLRLRLLPPLRRAALPRLRLSVQRDARAGERVCVLRAMHAGRALAADMPIYCPSVVRGRMQRTVPAALGGGAAMQLRAQRRRR